MRSRATAHCRSPAADFRSPRRCSKHLPAEYPAGRRYAAGVGIAAARASEPPGGMAAFLYMPHLFFVAAARARSFRGLDARAARVDPAIHRRIQHPRFLEKHPEATLARLREWTRDPSPHVRRLVSEGTRPRLPWAPRLRALPERSAPGASNCSSCSKDDPSSTCGRSVAQQPQRHRQGSPGVADGGARSAGCGGATPERRWIVGHALRSAVKRADPGRSVPSGYGGKAEVPLRDATHHAEAA